MSAIIVRKHVLRTEYSEYGSHLEVVYRTATSVSGPDGPGRPISDGNYFTRREQAEAAIDAWFASDVVGEALDAGAARCERGPEIEHRCDMNPRGLI